MSAHSGQVIHEFCWRCQWAYEAWRVHRVLFDESPRADKLRHSTSGPALVRISAITQEYFLQQIAKLHDPAVSRRKEKSLGIKYIIKFGGWNADVKIKLHKMQNQLEELYEKILPARNKILSHNDLDAILIGKALGAFPAEMDTAYFKTLQKFVNLVCENSAAGEFQFASDVVAETDLLAEALAK